MILFPGEFADLQIAGMRGRLPIHVARALERFIRTDAIEIVAAAALQRFHLAATEKSSDSKPGCGSRLG